MQRALALAESVLNDTSPNPRVGCVVCNAAGDIIGEGATQPVGGAHAEVMAIRAAQAKGLDTRGATAYVTLEPCAHQGRTGPCCAALVAAGITTVHAAITDPNPQVAGKGLAYLRANGVVVHVGEGHHAASQLNIGFFSRMIRNRPWVRLKVAASLDGQTALRNGQSQWITSELARQDGHRWRARACATLTGVGTLIQDNPRLDVRLVPTHRQPTAVLVDSGLKAPISSQWFGVERKRMVYFGQAIVPRIEALRHQSCDVLACPNAEGQVDLTAMLTDLAAHHINELHVEAGSKLNSSLLRAGLVDELLVYLAPRLLGQGQGMTALGPFQSLEEGLNLEFFDSTMLGPDLRLRARTQSASDFLHTL